MNCFAGSFIDIDCTTFLLQPVTPALKPRIFNYLLPFSVINFIIAGLPVQLTNVLKKREQFASDASANRATRIGGKTRPAFSTSQSLWSSPRRGFREFTAPTSD